MGKGPALPGYAPALAGACCCHTGGTCDAALLCCIWRSAICSMASVLNGCCCCCCDADGAAAICDSASRVALSMVCKSTALWGDGCCAPKALC